MIAVASRLWHWAEWPVPKHIRAGTSLRGGGVSAAPFDALNVAAHVGDSAEHVAENRKRLASFLALPAAPIWLKQTHSNHIIDIGQPVTADDADGAYTTECGQVCAVLTADCVPVLFCDDSGTKVAAIHAGWRGISSGIIEQAIKLYPNARRLFVWIGPCISETYYEVGAQLYEACINHLSLLQSAFKKKENGRWYCSLTGLITTILKEYGVCNIYDANLCTYQRSDLFYSYRRDGNTGRGATLIWIGEQPSS